MMFMEGLNGKKELKDQDWHSGKFLRTKNFNKRDKSVATIKSSFTCATQRELKRN